MNVLGTCSRRLWEILVQVYLLEDLRKLYEDVEKLVFRTKHLPDICDCISCEFMVVYRVGRVLCKCGQYHDLMLLSEGDDSAFTNCYKDHYGSYAKSYSKPLFQNSEDVNNIFGRKFYFTLILDNYTGVTEGSVH